MSEIVLAGRSGLVLASARRARGVNNVGCAGRQQMQGTRSLLRRRPCMWRRMLCTIVSTR